MSKKEKLKPVLDEKITKQLNLTVLQRLDPHVEEIITIAAHVTVYELNCDIVEWKRKNVQGSLFVVRRNTEPQFQFIVMNRLHEENLVENLVGDYEFEVQVPYLLYKNPSEVVNGLWFYNENECEEIANLFRRILSVKSEASPTTPSVSEIEKEAFLESSSTTTSKTTSAIDDNSVKISRLRGSFTALAPLQSTVSDAISSPPEQPASPSSSIMSLLNKKRPTNPAPFSIPSPPPLPPITSTFPTSSALISPGNLKHPYGTLLLHPIPPPPPPPPPPQSHTRTCVISRAKIAKALQLLVQDDGFVETVYRAALNATED